MKEGKEGGREIESHNNKHKEKDTWCSHLENKTQHADFSG